MQSDYSAQIRQVLAKSELKEKLKGMSGSLNLVNLEWKEHLQNSVHYQALEDINNFYTPFMKYKSSKYDIKNVSSEANLNVVVLAKCRISSDFKDKDLEKPLSNSNKALSFYIVECEPLEYIAQQMTKNFPGYQLSPFVKLFTSKCNPLLCYHCSKNKNAFELAGYKISSSNPCITTSCLFDGESVVNRFGCTIKNIFANSTFMAILEVSMTNVAFFKSDDTKSEFDKMRVGGFVKQFVLYDENKLQNTNLTTNLGIITAAPIAEENVSTNEVNETAKQEEGHFNDNDSKFSTPLPNDCEPLQKRPRRTCSQAKSYREDDFYIPDDEVL